MPLAEELATHSNRTQAGPSPGWYLKLPGACASEVPTATSIFLAPGPCSLPSCAVRCVTCGPLHRAGPTGLLRRGPWPSWAVLCTAWYAVPSTEQVPRAFSAGARGLLSWAAPSWGLGALQAACPLLLALRPVKLLGSGLPQSQGRERQFSFRPGSRRAG